MTRLVLQGYSTLDIAYHLVISVHTVQSHLRNIFTKTVVRARRDLVTKIPSLTTSRGFETTNSARRRICHCMAGRLVALARIADRARHKLSQQQGEPEHRNGRSLRDDLCLPSMPNGKHRKEIGGAIDCRVLYQTDLIAKGNPVTPSSRTTAGIAYDRAGPRRDLPVVLLHAGVADRRMWDPLWSALAVERDVVRLDFRGYGESTTRPHGMLSAVADVLDTLAELGIDRSHFVGASFGAAVAVEAALTQPRQVASLLLSPPGGSLIAELTPDLRAFIKAENAALERGDLGDAVQATLTWWVDGRSREAGDVDPAVRDLVRQMQRRAFEVTAGWDDIEERELDPAALDRLREIRVPTLVLVGSLDIEAIHQAARQVADGVAGARLVTWPNAAHLPSMERPDDFLALLRDWIAWSEARHWTEED